MRKSIVYMFIGLCACATLFTGCQKKQDKNVKAGNESEITETTPDKQESVVNVNADDLKPVKEDINTARRVDVTEESEKAGSNLPTYKDTSEIVQVLLSSRFYDASGYEYEFSGAENAMYITPADGERVMGYWSLGGTFDDLAGITIECPDIDVSVNGVVYDYSTNSISIKDTNTDAILELTVDKDKPSKKAVSENDIQ